MGHSKHTVSALELYAKSAVGIQVSEESGKTLEKN